jgi:hypothetical protein
VKRINIAEWIFAIRRTVARSTHLKGKQSINRKEIGDYDKMTAFLIIIAESIA